MRPKADRRHLRRGVVDTSVLVAGISAFRREPPNPQNTSARLLRGWVERRTFTWLVSVDILDEYRDVLRRLKVRRATVGRVINLLAEAAEAVPAGPYRGLSPDPGDEPFCACAENGGADFIVTQSERLPDGPAGSPSHCPGRVPPGTGTVFGTPHRAVSSRRPVPSRRAMWPLGLVASEPRS